MQVKRQSETRNWGRVTGRRSNASKDLSSSRSTERRRLTQSYLKLIARNVLWAALNAAFSLDLMAAPTASTGNQARHQSQPSAKSATPATQSGGRCHQVPRLPRKVEVDVAKCHACHAKSRGAHGVNWEPSAPPEPAQCHKCHACHAKWRSMSPSAVVCGEVACE